MPKAYRSNRLNFRCRIDAGLLGCRTVMSSIIRACFSKSRTPISVSRGRQFRYIADSDSAKSRTVSGADFTAGSRLRRFGNVASHEDVERGHAKTEASETNERERHPDDPAPDP